ncbi:MAG: hypothetical protein B6A08_10970 [Sorangiineae bacterium NIC37A_2]|nr:MAG: hypothetical protein B6A08_10970 [Sorangiineae bacterium NIC37A_2]
MLEVRAGFLGRAAPRRGPVLGGRAGGARGDPQERLRVDGAFMTAEAECAVRAATEASADALSVDAFEARRHAPGAPGGRFSHAPLGRSVQSLPLLGGVSAVD